MSRSGNALKTMAQQNVNQRQTSFVTNAVCKRLIALGFALALTGCASTSTAPDNPWENRLRGDTVVLLGEIHDNPEHHRQRLNVLRRALIAGWRPAIAMEQFDRERQADIDRARSDRPYDAQHVIKLAGLSTNTRSNWQWDFYRPFVNLALEYNLPLIAANLSNADIRKVVREGYSAVIDTATLHTLGLTAPLPAALLAAQADAVDIGHCNTLPPKMIPGMVRGQLARDAVMASITSQHALQGVVLLAGNSHVRRDIGVPRWLSPTLQARTLTVGYLERDHEAASNSAFDAVVLTAAAARSDPCIEFNKRLKPP